MSKSTTSAANVIAYTVYPEKADALRHAIEQHLIPAARKVEGYRGFLVLDEGDGKRLGVVVYDSMEHAQAAREPITAAARDSGVYEMMSERGSGGMGTAIIADGIFGAT